MYTRALKYTRALNAVSALVVFAATAFGATPNAVADPDTCDPDQGSFGEENSCAGAPPQTWPVAQGDFTSSPPRSTISPKAIGWSTARHGARPAARDLSSAPRARTGL